MKTYTIEQFNAQLESGAYAWPGGYPLYFVTSDGEALSFESAKKNADLIRSAITDKDNSGWRVIGCEINWEETEIYCADTGERIESAYAEKEAR